ncbi:MAG: FKBP-type peptidyl-prolyl cis-trans isomerase [Flavobacteriales bacterium]
MANLNKIKSDTTAFTFEPTSINDFTSLASMKDSISYFLGTDIAGGLTGNGFNKYYSELAFYKGLEDGFMGNAELVSKADGEKVAMKIMESEKENIMAAQKEQFAGNIAKGEAFLAEKTAQEDVVTLPSGLRYRIIKDGKGAKPAATDIVSTHYHGTLIDGTVFDSSVDRGEPTEFPVNRVIPGWTEALQLMSLGSKWELFIPYNLAYGEQGAGGSIEPYSTLIFEVELLEIKKNEE